MFFVYKLLYKCGYIKKKTITYQLLLVPVSNKTFTTERSRIMMRQLFMWTDNSELATFFAFTHD